MLYNGEPIGGSSEWGAITGTLTDQLDLQAALDAKASVEHTHSEYLTEETDPVFAASIAHSITQDDIDGWSAAVEWGNHQTFGYLTAETDPTFNSHVASQITSTQVGNWDTAYGWGNHASAGYLQSGAHALEFQAVAAPQADTTKSFVYGKSVLDTTSASTVLLMHFDGYDQSTTFTDSSSFNHSFSVFGDAKLSTAQSVFGGSSAYFDGTGDYITTPTSTDFDLGSGDFTIEARFRLTSLSGIKTIVGKSDAAPYAGWSLRVSTSTSIRFYYSIDGGASSPSFGFNCTLALNTWYHVAITRSGTNLRCFLNGVQIGITQTLSGSLNNSSAPLTVGCVNPSGTPANYFFGWIDEVRVIKGVAAWTANFTVPSTQNALTYSTVLATKDGSGREYLLGPLAQHNLLSTEHGDTVSASAVAGDLIYSNATAKWTRLPKGADGQYLSLASGLPAWATLPAPTPAGTDGAIQYNKAGVLGGDATKLKYDYVGNNFFAATGYTYNSGTDNFVSGSYHSITSETASAIFGMQNTVIGGGGNLVAGTGHTLDTVSSCTSLGFLNHLGTNIQQCVAIGGANTLSADTCLAIGRSNNVSGLYSTGIGLGNTVSGTAALAVGMNNTTAGQYSVTCGRYCQTSAVFDQAYGDTVISIGNGLDAGQAISFGYSFTNNTAGSVAIGFGAVQMKFQSGKVFLYNLPSSSTGLAAGQLWRDSNGFLKVV